MKGFILTVATLCLAAFTQAHVDYHLKCTKDEIGIRWPSYHSNSEYYICQRVGGKQVQMTCNPGEVFTFVLQACSSPSKFIPPPPIDILPTASPLLNHPGEPEELPKPLYPGDVNRPQQPPIINDHKPPSWEMPVPQPPHVGIDTPEHAVKPNEDDEHVIKPSLPNKPANPEKPSKPALPPMPPTPAPTPPVVHVQPPKKPSTPSKPSPNKKPMPIKPAPIKPSPIKKQPPNPPKAGKKPIVPQKPMKA